MALLLCLVAAGCSSAPKEETVTITTTITRPTPDPNVTVVLNGVRFSTEPLAADSHSPILGVERAPLPGKKFMICDITVTYKGQDRIDPYWKNFRLAADNRNEYPSLDTNNVKEKTLKGEKQFSARLLPSGSASGEIFFEVDSAVQTGTITYVGDVFLPAQ
jgi:hypothetical protein